MFPYGLSFGVVLGVGFQVATSHIIRRLQSRNKKMKSALLTNLTVINPSYNSDEQDDDVFQYIWVSRLSFIDNSNSSSPNIIKSHRIMTDAKAYFENEFPSYQKELSYKLPKGFLQGKVQSIQVTMPTPDELHVVTTCTQELDEDDEFLDLDMFIMGQMTDEWGSDFLNSLEHSSPELMKVRSTSDFGEVAIGTPCFRSESGSRS